MNGCPDEVDILFRSYGSVSFKIEISAEELEIDWGDGEHLLCRPEGWMVVGHEFCGEGKFAVGIKGRRIAGLNVARQDLTALSLRCSRLEYLDCSVNELNELELSRCPALEELYCNSNDIAELPLAGHPHLLLVNVSYNRLKSLDVGGCPSLRTLYAAGNRLERVELGSENSLHYLDLGNNLLDGKALEAIFRHFLPASGEGVIHYMQNPGTDVCNATLLRGGRHL